MGSMSMSVEERIERAEAAEEMRRRSQQSPISRRPFEPNLPERCFAHVASPRVDLLSPTPESTSPLSAPSPRLFLRLPQLLAASDMVYIGYLVPPNCVDRRDVPLTFHIQLFRAHETWFYRSRASAAPIWPSGAPPARGSFGFACASWSFRLMNDDDGARCVYRSRRAQAPQERARSRP